MMQVHGLGLFSHLDKGHCMTKTGLKQSFVDVYFVFLNPYHFFHLSHFFVFSLALADGLTLHEILLTH